MDIKYILDEQRRQMLEYKALRCDESGYDLGETALIDWVDRFAADFRDWAENIPLECLHCGDCLAGESGIECLHPFNLKRQKLIKNLRETPSDEEDHA